MSDEVYIVLFRGVGGATKLPVKELKLALGFAGFRHVRTYIATGNVVLASELDASAVKQRVAGIARAEFAFTKAVMVLNRRDMAAIVKRNPFPRAAANPRTLHVFVLDSAPEKSALAALSGRMAAGPEEFAVRGKALYLHTPDGFGTSKIPAAVEKALKSKTTARNWNTVVKLKEIADEVAVAAKGG